MSEDVSSALRPVGSAAGRRPEVACIAGEFLTMCGRIVARAPRAVNTFAARAVPKCGD
ncbi:MAG TPA: hypothetical protein VE713_06415 [Pyrinomonadaceae bacterium]|nr:hypothetical protein [Pyrinomonadaceae bacterium]